MGVLEKYELLNLMEQIERIDKMVKFHSSNSSKFMLEQYAHEKQELLNTLISKFPASNNTQEIIKSLHTDVLGNFIENGTGERKYAA